MTDWNERLLRQADAQRAQRAEELERAKDEAHARGKEPFDIDALEALWTPYSTATSADRDRRRRRWEERYYVYHPKVMTIAEFAELMVEHERQGAFD